MLNTLIKRLKNNNLSPVKADSVFQGRYLKRLPVERLLHSYRDQLDDIKVLTGVPDKHFEYLYLTPLKTYVSFMQLAPASESHHHSEHGGMIAHTLEVIVNALRLRRGQILPTGVPPEEIEHRKDIWTFVVFVCALLHDAGKLISDVEFHNEKGEAWNLLSTMPPPSLYRVIYNAGRRHKFHEKLASFALYKIFNQDHINWIMTDDEAWYALVNYLTANYTEASVIAEIIQKADQASVVANLGGNVNDVIKRPVQALSLPERMLKSLQQLLEENAIGVNKQGAIGYVDGDYVYFTVKPMLDKVKEKMRDQGLSIPASNNTLMGELQQSNIVESNGDKATFKVRVNVGNWQQDFSVLKIHVMKAWPEKRPATNDTIQVVQINEDGEVVTSHDASNEKHSALPAQPSSTLPKIEQAPKQNQTDQTLSPDQSKNAQPIKSEPNNCDINADVKQSNPIVEPLDDFAELDDVMGHKPQSDHGLPGNYEDLSDIDPHDDIDSDTEAWSPAMATNDIEYKSEIVSASNKKPKKEQQSPENDVKNRNSLMNEVKNQIADGSKNFVNKYNDEVLDTQINFADLDDPGAQFIGWLKSGLKTGAIPLNIPGGAAHFVDEGLFLVSPQIFRTFQAETGVGWSQAQRSVTKSSRKINLKTPKGENMFTYEILSKTGRTKDIGRIKGILIPSPSKKLGITIKEINTKMNIVE
ncbi:MobH family relaxase [Thiomicrospira sp. R3]|uniref:MobH family relaxase n=1 Tax=Thiomicrospira sp. R3 TaxID=3035472 RepID=UPI00259BF388|nr:MobH family relaxase [Thiomicrospira sp. R3]WFE68090.1 MobH family relaxase [Thiomicrospira sp. R3]